MARSQWVVGIASSVSEARRLIRMLAFHVAVLDLHLADGEVTPVQDKTELDP